MEDEGLGASMTNPLSTFVFIRQSIQNCERNLNASVNSHSYLPNSDGNETHKIQL